MSITERSASGISTRQVAGNIGAELQNIKLSGDLEPEVVERIRSDVLRHKVVFFRGQGHLDDDEHAAFASLLGPLTIAHPTVPGLDSNPIVFNISSMNGGRANNWHTDVTFVERPPSFSVLRAVHLPPVGGDTVWANPAAAYSGLPEDLRHLAGRLWAVHTTALPSTTPSPTTAWSNATSAGSPSSAKFRSGSTGGPASRSRATRPTTTLSCSSTRPTERATDAGSLSRAVGELEQRSGVDADLLAGDVPRLV
jgi:alpha-ketoglutarate-dependent taurine dioxygenase